MRLPGALPGYDLPDSFLGNAELFGHPPHTQPGCQGCTHRACLPRRQRRLRGRLGSLAAYFDDGASGLRRGGDCDSSSLPTLQFRVCRVDDTPQVVVSQAGDEGNGIGDRSAVGGIDRRRLRHRWSERRRVDEVRLTGIFCFRGIDPKSGVVSLQRNDPSFIRPGLDQPVAVVRTRRRRKRWTGDSRRPPQAAGAMVRPEGRPPEGGRLRLVPTPLRPAAPNPVRPRLPRRSRTAWRREASLAP